MLKDEIARSKKGATQMSAKAIGVGDVKELLKATLENVGKEMTRKSTVMRNSYLG